jgi:hypothetical protein
VYVLYIFMSVQWNAEQYYNINIANESFQNVAKGKCLETTLKIKI